MAQLALDDYPDRYALVNELHARPFPGAGARPAGRSISRSSSRRTPPTATATPTGRISTALLDRYGAPHPPPGASHYYGPVGRGFLKWEMHTEFVTYTLFADGVAPKPFSGEMFDLFPADWLAEAPGRVVTSCLVRIETAGAARTSRRASPPTCRSGSCRRASRSAGWWTARR